MELLWKVPCFLLLLAQAVFANWWSDSDYSVHVRTPSPEPKKTLKNIKKRSSSSSLRSELESTNQQYRTPSPSPCVPKKKASSKARASNTKTKNPGSRNLAAPLPANNSLEALTLHKESCLRLEYLAERQKQLCLLSDKMIQVLQTGALQAVEECQHQFRHSRWNCSTVQNSSDIFGGVLKFKSREAAVVHALSSAALAHAVARACSRGELNECSCDARVRKRTPRHWQWGGCSEDIRYGEIFSRDFVDSREDKTTDEGLMNLHNNEAGRRAVRGRMQRVCKCHGMSGSCSVRVCWRRLPPLRAVGDALSTRYEGASHVKIVERKRGKHIRKLRPLHADMKKPNKTDLVYLEDSPDYCEPNYELGILGTRGRSCNRTSAGLDGCSLLCCGRGYQTRVRDHEEKCRCRFVWCCKVHCELCRYKRDHHVCN